MERNYWKEVVNGQEVVHRKNEKALFNPVGRDPKKMYSFNGEELETEPGLVVPVYNSKGDRINLGFETVLPMVGTFYPSVPSEYKEEVFDRLLPSNVGQILEWKSKRTRNGENSIRITARSEADLGYKIIADYDERVEEGLTKSNILTLDPDLRILDFNQGAGRSRISGFIENGRNFRSIPDSERESFQSQAIDFLRETLSLTASKQFEFTGFVGESDRSIRTMR